MAYILSILWGRIAAVCCIKFFFIIYLHKSAFKAFNLYSGVRANLSFSLTFYQTGSLSLDYNLLVISCVGKEWHLEGSLPLRCEGGPVLPPAAEGEGGWESEGVCRGPWTKRKVNHFCNRTGFP